MALSSAKLSVSQDKSPSRSPLSPTVIHYRQKYQIPKVSQDYHREIRRYHHPRKQQIRNTSRQHHQNGRINRIPTRRQSSNLWQVHKSSTGRIYYYNVITDQSQWEKPPREQLSSSNYKKNLFIQIDSFDFQTSYNTKDLSVNNQYHSKKFNQSTSNSTFISDDDFDSIRSRSSDIHHRSINNSNRTEIITTNNHHHHKRRKDNIEIKSSFKKFRKDKRKTDEVVLSTPISPPANEKIQIDLVDPIPTPNNSITNISISFIDSQQQSHYQISSISLNENKSNSSDSKQPIKRQINEDLSSTFIQSSLCPSESTINAILELEHSSPVKQQCSSPILSTITNSNFDHITRYYRAELIEHLLNWPSTQIEREAIRLSNEQIRFTTCQLISLRTDLFSLRLKFERNRFHLRKYHYSLVNQQDLLNKLQLIDSDQI